MSMEVLTTVSLILDRLTDEELAAVFFASLNPNGFTQDSLGYEKAKRLFEPEARPDVMQVIQKYTQYRWESK